MYEIADLVINAGYEQSITPDAVNKRLQIEFLKLKKLLVSQFEQGRTQSWQYVGGDGIK